MTPGEYIRTKSNALVELEREVRGLGMKCTVVVYDERTACMASLEENRKTLTEVLTHATFQSLAAPSGKMNMELGGGSEHG